MADAWLSCARTLRVRFDAFTPFHFYTAGFHRRHEVRDTSPGNTAPTPKCR